MEEPMTTDDAQPEAPLTETVYAPAVTVRVHPDTGPAVMVEWRDQPTPGEVIVVAEALLNASRFQYATGGVVLGGKPYIVTP